MTQKPLPHKPKSVQRKSEARLATVKALYAHAMNEDKKDALALGLDVLSYYSATPEKARPDEKMLYQLIEEVLANQDTLKQKISSYLEEGWSLNRLETILAIILQTGICELMLRTDLPYKVIINEYVDITHEYFGEKEVGFVNSVLDAVAKETHNT